MEVGRRMTEEEKVDGFIKRRRRGKNKTPYGGREKKIWDDGKRGEGKKRRQEMKEGS